MDFFFGTNLALAAPQAGLMAPGSPNPSLATAPFSKADFDSSWNGKAITDPGLALGVRINTLRLC